MKRQDELQVPVEEVEQFSFTLDNLVEGWDQALISALLLGHLFLDVFPQVTYRCNVVINFVELASDEKYSNLMKDNCRRVHEFHFECLRCHFLAECQVILVYHLNGRVNCLSCLSELNAHLVDAVNNSLPCLENCIRARLRRN